MDRVHLRAWYERAREPGALRRAAPIAVVLSLPLFIVHQAAEIATLSLSPLMAGQAVLTFLVVLPVVAALLPRTAGEVALETATPPVGGDSGLTPLINKFPDMNPNPVFRVSRDGRLLYANAASSPILDALGMRIAEPFPHDLVEGIRRCVAGSSDSLEVQAAGHWYALKPVEIAEFEFVNVYATDVTGLKAMNRFPDANPNPVLRVSRDGDLVYANAASAVLIDAFRLVVGQRVHPDLWSRVLKGLEPGADPSFEIEHAGRVVSFLVVSLYEFSSINLYGTDVTAARQVERAHHENEGLLLNILPEPIAARLRQGERLIADRFDDVTLLFADIVDFTRMSSQMTASDVVTLLNEVFSVFDSLVDRYQLEKIKTIGDAYMVVGGLSASDDGDHTARVADMALDLLDEVARLRPSHGHPISFRVGINTGPTVAGVIGRKKFIYDVWGDTVNTASRMESHGVPGRIQVTEPVYERLRGRFELERRGVVDVRGKGPMPTYFLLGRARVPASGARR